LLNGPNQFSGILQIYFNGVWGTVCQDRFTDAAAQVVCRQLGFEGGSVLLFALFGVATGVVWLDDVDCSGSEGNLDQCSHAPWGEHNCMPVHMLDVSIQCSGEPAVCSCDLVSIAISSHQINLHAMYMYTHAPHTQHPPHLSPVPHRPSVSQSCRLRYKPVQQVYLVRTLEYQLQPLE